MGRDVKEPQGGESTLSTHPPPCKRQSRQNWHFVQDSFVGAYRTRRAAIWDLPTIRLQQRLGLPIEWLPGLGLLLGLDLVLLLSLGCTPGGCGSCVDLLLLLQQGGVRNRTDSPPANVAYGTGKADFIGLNTNGNKQDRPPRTTPPGGILYYIAHENIRGIFGC